MDIDPFLTIATKKYCNNTFLFQDKNDYYLDVARDFDHPGIDSNIKIFKYIKERIDGI